MRPMRRANKMGQGRRGNPPPYPPPQGGREHSNPSPLVGEGRVGGGTRRRLILLGPLRQRQSPFRPFAGLFARFAAIGLALAVPGRAAVAQAPAAPPAGAQEGQPVNDLTTRYRFIERYSTVEERTKPEVISQYQVAVKETIKTVSENAQGAPGRRENVIHAIFSERPAQVSSLGVVTSAVRRYDAFRLAPPPPAKPSDKPLLEGLTLWYHR